MRIEEFQKNLKRDNNNLLAIRPDEECLEILDEFLKIAGNKANKSAFIRKAIKVGGRQILDELKKSKK